MTEFANIWTPGGLRETLAVLVSCENRTPDGYILDGPAVLFPGQDSRSADPAYTCIEWMAETGVIDRYWFKLRHPRSEVYPVRGMLIRINLESPFWNDRFKDILEKEKATRLKVDVPA